MFGNFFYFFCVGARGGVYHCAVVLGAVPAEVPMPAPAVEPDTPAKPL